MERYQFTYKNYQLRLTVDADKKIIQIAIINPTNSGHSVVKIYKINDDTPIENQEQVIASVESWDQLDAAIESAAKIFQNIPVDSE